eukprot:tig00000737_g3795.t1
MSSPALSRLRAIHRSVSRVFRGDRPLQEEARRKIREEFAKNRHETDPAKIQEMLAAVDDTIQFMETEIVQAVYDPNAGIYKARVDEKHASPTLPSGGGGGCGSSGCGSGSSSGGGCS